MKRMCITVFGLIFWGALSFATVNPSTSPFGINVHLSQNDTLGMVTSAGIKWIRIDINWKVCEPVKGKYVFTDVDRVVEYAARNDLSILGAIGYTPEWANGGRGGNYPPDDSSDWKRFVGKAVQRYTNRIKYWNIWNEPNVPEFFAEGKDVFVRKVFLPAAKAIHNQDPGAFVVGPELAHLTASNQEWFLWMKYILTEAKDHIDVVSHHLYDSRGGVYVYELLESGEPLIPSVKNLVEECGLGDRPFWLTETGWNTLAVSEEIQGELYLEILQLRRLKGYPDKIFFYEIRDDVDPSVSSWGILRSDGTPKQAYYVYRDFIAGNYPPGDISPIPEEEKDDCYAERLFPTTRGMNVLPPLRWLRDVLMSQVPGGGSWVKAYYLKSEELFRLTMRDSRLFKTGRRVVLQTLSSLSVKDGDFWRTPVSRELKIAVNEWLELALEQDMDKGLHLILTNISGMLKALPEQGSALDLIRMRNFMRPARRCSN